MQEEWREIPSFPGYSVSDAGSVRNDETDRLMAKLVNQRGIVNVGLTKNKIQYKRALANLVAEAFLIRPSFEFDTPIQLDGNRLNNTASNLLWRPRWFATRYFRQFHHKAASIVRPIEVVETEEVFEDSWAAATSLGVIDVEIAESVMTRNYVWPLFQHFRLHS